jgi:hypothetical protein
MIMFFRERVMVAGQRKKTEHSCSPAVTVGLKLLGAAFVYLALQLVIVWTGKYLISSSLEASQVIHNLLAWADNLTPALSRLKAFYHRPIDGFGFDQVFVIYILVFAFLCFYFVTLCVLTFAGLFANVRWREWVVQDYAFFAFMCGLGLWAFYFFLIGPTTLDFRTLFGAGYLSSICLLVPFGEFLIFVVLTIYFSMGAASRNKM